VEAGYDVRVITAPEFNVMRHRFDAEKITFEDAYGDFHVINIADIHGVLAAPPCTKFSRADWKTKKKDRDFRTGMETVKACMEIIWGIQEHGVPLDFWALENPQGYLYNFLGQPAFWFQPWMFGDQKWRTKRTAIWGYFNPPSKTVRKRKFPFTKEGKNKHWYGATAKDRAITPAGFARAFFKANP
jgi:hypothetical protein